MIFTVNQIDINEHHDPPTVFLYLSYKVEPIDVFDISFDTKTGQTKKIPSGVSDTVNFTMELPAKEIGLIREGSKIEVKIRIL